MYVGLANLQFMITEKGRVRPVLTRKSALCGEEPWPGNLDFRFANPGYIRPYEARQTKFN